MNKQQILEALQMLAQSQGSYGRLLHSWMEWNMLDEALEELESYQLNDVIDLILLIEGGA